MRNFFVAILLSLSWIGLIGSASAATSPKKIKVLSFKDGHSLAVQSELGQFERETGIEVQMDLLPASSIASKIVTDQAGRGQYDVYLVDEPYVPQFASLLKPLQEWAQPSPDTDPERYVGAALRAGTFEGNSFGLPVNGNVYLPIYRKDLFEDPGERKAFKSMFGRDLRPPLTAKELTEIARFFYRPPNLYGFAPFTKLSEGTTVEFIWLLSLFGHELLDGKSKLNVTAENFSEAFQAYRELLQYSPSGSRSWHHPERMRAYSRGQIAFMMTWPSFLRDLEDSSKSLVVGKTGYTLAPRASEAKEALSSAVSGTWTIAVSRRSKNPEWAAQFAYWWAGSRSGQELVPRGMNPARRDLLSSESLVKKNPWFPAVLQNFESARVRPRIKSYNKLSQSLSRAFTQAVNVESASDIGPISASLVSELEAVIGR